MVVTDWLILSSLTPYGTLQFHAIRMEFSSWILVVPLEQACKARETSGFAELFLLLILFYLELFSQDFQPQRLDDGYLEVIGLTSATLVSGNVN